MSEATKFYPPSKVNLIPHFSPFTPKTIGPNSISLPPTPILFTTMREKALKKGRQIMKNTSITMRAKSRRGPWTKWKETKVWQAIQFRKSVETTWIDWIMLGKKKTKTWKSIPIKFMTCRIQTFWKEISRVDWPNGPRIRLNTITNSNIFWGKSKDKPPEATSKKLTSNLKIFKKHPDKVTIQNQNSHHSPGPFTKALLIPETLSIKTKNIQANIRANRKTQNLLTRILLLLTLWRWVTCWTEWMLDQSKFWSIKNHWSKSKTIRNQKESTTSC